MSRTRTETDDKRAFFVARPRLWNSLSLFVSSRIVWPSKEQSTFKSRLKTHLFHLVFLSSWRVFLSPDEWHHQYLAYRFILFKCSHIEPQVVILHVHLQRILFESNISLYPDLLWDTVRCICACSSAHASVCNWQFVIPKRRDLILYSRKSIATKD